MTVDPAILETLRGRLVVSCQPVAGGPLDRPAFAVGMAEAAVAGGACAVRLEGIDAVSAGARRLGVPVIGIVKRELAVERLAAAGAAIIAVDATDRERPVPVPTLVQAIHDGGGIAMADCATLEEGLAAAEMGFEIVGSTLSGYTGGPVPEQPDFELVERLAAHGLRVMAEGRIKTPAQAATALERGAWSVTVGSAITRVEHVTGWFADALGSAAR